MRRIVLALAALVLSAGTAAAQQDPPGRVGRLSYTEGAVLLHLPGPGDWVAATVNFPLTTGVSLWTDPSARAEMQVGAAEFSLDQASELDLIRLDDGATQLQLDQGAVYLHLWEMPDGGVSVATPRGRAVLLAPGSYDIAAASTTPGAPPDQVTVTVLEGAARFDTDRGSVNVGASEAAIVSGQPMNLAIAAAAYSDFDNWALARERREVAAEQPGYIAPEVTGYQDLNQYGSWASDPTYGGVWYPADLPPGWAPYRYGHWAFVPPWGWTWIDDAPWGFAPFHYGRWAEIGGRWGWIPGQLAPRPVYAPALVAFIGGDGWAVDLAAGPAVAAIGWVALGPNEVYHPYYHASATYVRNVNITNVNRTVINNITMNSGGDQRVGNFHNRDAATVVSAQAFTRAAPIERATVSVPQAQLQQATTSRSLAQLRPDAGARTGHAVPAAAPADLPQPNAPAQISKSRVTPPPPPAPNAGPSGATQERTVRRETNPPQTQIQTQAPIAPPQVQAPPGTPAPRNEERRPEITNAAPPPQTQAPPAPRQVAPAPQQATLPPQPHLQPQTRSYRPPPTIEMQHPAQDTHIAPTPQAWTRTPGPPPAPAQNVRAAHAPPQPPSQPAQKPATNNAPPPGKGQPGRDERQNQQH